MKKHHLTAGLRHLFAAMLLLAAVPAMAQANYQALRFRQPLAYHQYLMRLLHRQTAERNAALAEATRSPEAMQAYITDARQRLRAVVAHAAVLDSRIARATLTRTLRSWRSYLENPMQYDMLSNIIYGALRDYDLPDLIRLSGGRVTYGD